MLRLVTHPSPPVLLDERHHLVVAVEAALSAPACELSQLDDTSPGAYLLFYCGSLDLYRPIARPASRRSVVEVGGYPIYAGSATSLRERRQRHQRNVRSLVDLGEEDLLIVPVPTPSPAGAAFFERLFITAFHPVWNQPWLAGFGSRPQGAARERGQRVAAWNVLHPGRRTNPRAPRAAASADELAAQVKLHLSEAVSGPFRSA